jgi:O-antigen/teichoic acid export membrane protein
MRYETIKPYFYQFLGRALPQFVAIGISSIIVKVAGIAVFGQYSLLFALVSVIYGVFGSALDKDFQRSCTAQNVVASLSAKIVLWLILLPVLFSMALPLKLNVHALIFVLVGVLFQQSIETRIIRDRILGDDVKSILPRFIPVLLFFLLLFFVNPKDLQGVALLFAISWSVSIVFLFHIIKQISLNIKNAIIAIKGIFPIWVSMIMTQAYGNLDLYLVRLYHSDDIVGIYKLSYTFAGIVMPIAGVFSFIFLSKISKAISVGDISSTKRIFKDQLKINGALGLLLVIFIFIFFPFIAPVLYGESGRAAVFTAMILSLAMSLNMIAMVYSYALLALRKERAIAIMSTVGASLYLTVAFFLIPRFGANGAACAMTLVYLFLVIFYHLIYKKVDFGRFPIRTL